MITKAIIYTFLMLANVFCLIKSENKHFNGESTRLIKSHNQYTPVMGLLCYNFNHIPKY
jgi:hypothetical protein